MKNFSDINMGTSKEQVIDLTCSKTSLSKEFITKLYENNNLLGLSDNEIIKKFDNIFNNIENETFDSNQYIDELNKLVLSLSLNDGSTNEDKHKFTMDFVNMLDSFVYENKIDSVNLLDIVTKILILTGKKDTDKYIENLIIEEVDNQQFHKLNESFTPLKKLLTSNINDKSTVFLFENLKTILTKNNKRWGHNYHLTNVYNNIMNYLTDEVETMLAKEKMISVDEGFNKILISEMLSGNVNPLYKDYNSISHLITDVQTVVFDMILIIDRFINNKTDALKFVKHQTYIDYKNSSSTLLSMIISSIKTSTLYDEKTIDSIMNENKWNFQFSSHNYELINNNYMVDKLSDMISFKNNYPKQNSYFDINIKSVLDMLKFIQSVSVNFNLKIRPAMRIYITKGYELVQSSERANYLLNKTR